MSPDQASDMVTSASIEASPASNESCPASSEVSKGSSKTSTGHNWKERGIAELLPLPFKSRFFVP